MRRRHLIGLAVGIVCAVPACSGGSDTTTASPVTIHGTTWRRADVRGQVVTTGRGLVISDVVVVGEDGDDAVVSDVKDGRVSESFKVPLQLEHPRGLDSTGDVAWITTNGDPGGESEFARTWVADKYRRAHADQIPRDSAGRQASWLEPLGDDEGDGYLVGVVRTGDTWRVRAWIASWEDGHWIPLDAGPPLLTPRFPQRDDVVMAAEEGAVVVAGNVSRRAGAQDPEVWSIGWLEDEPATPWTRVPLDPTPDGVTDVYAWPVGFWVAGHRNGRPVVYDFDDDGGRLVDLPDIELDPDDPTVLLHQFQWEVPIMGVQTERGPSAWYRVDGAWHELRLPAGELRGLQRAGRWLYVQLGGEIWYAELPVSARI